MTAATMARMSARAKQTTGDDMDGAKWKRYHHTHDDDGDEDGDEDGDSGDTVICYGM